MLSSNLSILSRNSISLSNVGPSIKSLARTRAKKNDCRRASPTTQYSSSPVSIAQIEGNPMSRAFDAVRKPIAAEIAIRTPAYEPGPNPTTIVSGAPNCFCASARFSKNVPEFFRSFGHSRARLVLNSVEGAISSFKRAMLPRTVESSRASTLISFGAASMVYVIHV